jgi:ribonuclease Z
MIYKDEGLEITSILLDHKTPILAYRFKEKDKLKINFKSNGFEGRKWVKELKEAFEKGENEKIITIGKKEYKVAELHYLLQIKKGDTVGIIMDHAANE